MHEQAWANSLLAQSVLGDGFDDALDSGILPINYMSLYGKMLIMNKVMRKLWVVPRALRSVESWFRRQNERGKYLRIRAVLCLCLYHPRERFINYIIVQLNTALGRWQRIKLPPGMLNGRFHICFQGPLPDRKVVKLSHGRSGYSCSLIKVLKQPEALMTYQSTLKNVKLDPWLQNHCVTVTRVRRDGGYDSEYIEGFNLTQLRDELFNSGGPPKGLHAGLIKACEELLEDLSHYYGQHGELIGDWFLHNLIFSPEKGSIINVDAEGFFTCNQGRPEAHLPCVRANLSNFIDLIKLRHNPDPDGSKILEVLKAVDEVRHGREKYSGHLLMVGYHSLELRGKKFRGQRECSERLAQVPFDFNNKVVLDLGCNVGGMLHCLAKRIRKGYGADVNPNCINAARLVSRLNRAANLEFFPFDLDKQAFSTLRGFLSHETVDIVFLLSMCLWLRRGPRVVQEASQMADTLLFESNGSSQQQDEQAAWLGKYYRRVNLLSDSSPDDLLLSERKLFLCTQ